jgi:hypothetical protein
MTHRDVRVSVYGAVLGVMLGAGAFAFVQNASLEASATPTVLEADARFHEAPSPDDYARRNVDKKGLQLNDDEGKNNYPTVKSSSSSSSSSSSQWQGGTTCDAVMATILKIQKVYLSVVPANVKNTDIRRKMDAVIADSMDDYCTPVADSSSSAVSSSSSSSVSTKVNNHCENYPRQTARYTQCVISEQNGQKFPIR